VQRILEPSIADLCAPGAIEVERLESGGRLHDVPFFRVEGERVWGATAMILAEFLALIGCPPRQGAP
jgi:hypothetical protein